MMKILTVVIALLAVSFAAAQEMDMKPPKELKNVEFFLGTWKGTETYMMGGPPEKVTATMVGTRAVGGRWLHTTHHSKPPKGPAFEGLHILSYDVESKQHKAWWFDNAASYAMEMEGTWSGNTLSMISKPTPMPGSPEAVVFRATWTKVSARQMTFRLDMKQGDNWAKVISGSYRKR